MSDGSMPTRFRVGTWVVSERRNLVYNGSGREDNPLDEQTTIDVPIVSADVRLTPRLGLQFSTAIPMVVRTGTVQRGSGPVTFRDEVRGLGDTTVGVWYRRARSGWTWTLNGGLSIPTGSTRKPVFRPELEGGSLVPMSRLSRGSGTWDPLLGVVVERPLAGGRWVGSLAARTPLADNRDGLRVGASWEVGSGWAHTVGTHKVMGYVRGDWLHREQDVFNGLPVLVGGGNWVYASPGMAVMVGKGINVQAEVKLPVYRQLANRQLDSRAIFQFGVTRGF
jgi:hypothetical protein